MLWLDGKTYQAKTIELDVIDRIGGGDGFASGLFYGLLNGKDRSDGTESRLGSRSVADDISRRHDDGDDQGSRSSGVWWFGAGSAIVMWNETQHSENAAFITGRPSG